MSDSPEESALAYHSIKPAGKLTIAATKPLANQVDLSQAYSPSVAYPCLRIEKDPPQVDGEMHADAALSESIRSALFLATVL